VTKKPRKPLKRSPLKRSTKPIAQKSEKRKEADIDRRAFVASMLSDYPYCVACPVFAKHDGLVTYTRRPSQDVHELKRRSQGGSVVDRDNCIAVCRKCHTRIGNYPQLAFDLGLAKRSWEL
jgi:5-methylcytosine-specific restriction endonuclease McrA